MNLEFLFVLFNTFGVNGEKQEPLDFRDTSMKQKRRSHYICSETNQFDMESEKKKLKKRKVKAAVAEDEEPVETFVPEVEEAPISRDEGKKSKKKARRGSDEDVAEAVSAEQVDEHAEVPTSREEEKRSKKKTRRGSDEDVTEAAPADPVEEQVTAAVQAAVKGNNILSDDRFADLPLCNEIKSALQSLGFERMSHIQARAIPEALAGRDIVGAAKTGSGYAVNDISDYNRK